MLSGAHMQEHIHETGGPSEIKLKIRYTSSFLNQVFPQSGVYCCLLNHGMSKKA